MTRRNPNIVRQPGEGARGPVRTHPPDDFADFAPHLTRAELVDRYGRNPKVIARWLLEAEVQSKPVNTIELLETARRKAALERRAPVTSRNNAYMVAPVDRPHRDESLAGQAADYLRRISAVIRCDRNGRYDPRGDHWRRGSTILTADEVIERADRNGWRDAERRRCA